MCIQGLMKFYQCLFKLCRKLCLCIYTSYEELQREITLIEMAPSPYIFIISIGPVDMNKYARFDEIPSMTLKDIKETKRYGRTDGRTDNVKTVYPPTNTVCGGYKNAKKLNTKSKTCLYCTPWIFLFIHQTSRRNKVRI